ncbi:hypothetical protein HY379_02040 [Candidatus Saccharibacteria bacterium]|nr:hypothetical protein [Candidatus Saccharibacteria bacterium]
MELNPKDYERLRRALVAGAALIATGVTVKYIRDHEGRARGYFYKLNQGKDWLMGVYRDDEMTDIAQISGGLNEEQFVELDTPQVVPEDVEKFEEVIEIAKQNQQAS